MFVDPWPCHGALGMVCASTCWWLLAQIWCRLPSSVQAWTEERNALPLAQNNPECDFWSSQGTLSQVTTSLHTLFYLTKQQPLYNVCLQTPPPKKGWHQTKTQTGSWYAVWMSAQIRAILLSSVMPGGLRCSVMPGGLRCSTRWAKKEPATYVSTPRCLVCITSR